MTPQIIGTKKSREFRSCERYCRERGIAFQHRDPLEKPLSDGELESIMSGGIGGDITPEDLIDSDSRAFRNKGLAYMDYDPIEELREEPALLRQPIVRTDKGAAVQPDSTVLAKLFGR